jgi:hypothetical protein
MKAKKKEKLKEVYMVGILNDWYEEGFEILGVFSTYKKALCACLDETFFIGTFNMDVLHEHNLIKEMNAHFPLEKEETIEDIEKELEESK